MSSVNPYTIVKRFEYALSEYTGAPYVVSCSSCTMALFLVLQWFRHTEARTLTIDIPKRTYVGAAMSVINSGYFVSFRDELWTGEYQLKPYPIWDCARWLRSSMYRSGQFMCLSFHHTKHLGLAAHGGAILHDNPNADTWLRRARFDGRQEGVAPKDDVFDQRGWHCYCTPPTAAEGIMRLSMLPLDNEPLASDDYPDLSQYKIFQ